MFIKLLLFALMGMGITFATPSSKLSTDLVQSLKQKTNVNIFVKFEVGNKPAIQRTESLRFSNRGAKISNLVDNLKSLAQNTQGNATSLLKGRSKDFKQFWVSNELYIREANDDLITSLAALHEVVQIREEIVFPVPSITFSNFSINAFWNLEKIEAPKAWSLSGGNNGAGIVVAIIDTGVRGTHEALKNNHRKTLGWFDPYASTRVPYDDNGHGTHCTGTIAGSGIGVAPGAEWIACKGMDANGASSFALFECAQWIICPTDPLGESADCTKAPNVVSNSWGIENDQGQDLFDPIFEAWHAANIVPIFAAGNSGPNCNTVELPGDSGEVISVGATTSTDSIAEFSSVGPSYNGRFKPDISAPGHSIRSAWSTGDSDYNIISGTSMACPHVAGAAAILLSRNPNLTYPQLRQLLIENTDKNLANTGLVCSGTDSTHFPNHQYGHGRLNVLKSLATMIPNDGNNSALLKCPANTILSIVFIFQVMLVKLIR